MIGSILAGFAGKRVLASLWGLVWRFLNSWPGRILVIGLALFTWHQIDKTSAVRKAVNEYVAGAELTSLRVQLEETKRRKAVTDRANARHLTRIEQAFADAEAAAEELEHYASTVESSCVVQPDLIDRLRNR